MQRERTATVATEADRLEAAIAAAGLDPSAGESYPIWTAWQTNGLRAALAALREETDMEIPFNPDAPWTEATKHDAHGPYQVQRQTVWQQVEPDTWIEVTIERSAQPLASGKPYVASVVKRSGPQPRGGWRNATNLERTRVRLVADASAQPSAPPAAPERPAHTGQRYIDRAYRAPQPKE